MITVCEPIRWNLEHSPCNAALLATIRHAYPGTPIVFWGEETHVQCVRRQIGPGIASSIWWHTLQIAPRHSLFLERVSSDFRMIKQLLVYAKKRGCLHIVLMSVNASILLGLKCLMRMIGGDYKVQIVFHGELETVSWVPRNPFIRAQSLRTALGIDSNEYIQYIVLEESIRKSLLREIPYLDGHVGVLDHPIPPNEGLENRERLSYPVRFGLLGLATKQKGFLTFLKTAEKMSGTFRDRVEFHAIGALHEDFRSVALPEIGVLKTRPGNGFLSRHEYALQVANLDFVCFFSEGKYYQFSPSGSLLDAIAWEKPIVASKVGIIEDLANKFGDIGYVGECSREVEARVEEIVTNLDSCRYERQQEAMRQVKVSRSPEALASKYRELCKDLV